MIGNFHRCLRTNEHPAKMRSKSLDDDDDDNDDDDDDDIDNDGYTFAFWSVQKSTRWSHIS